jgi:GTP diphosphokinase / guanosine-3',5'-bis(diphosphate) 3'-diphosphatase
MITTPVRPGKQGIIRQYQLVERVKSYDPDADEDALNRAYVFTMKAHGSQIRASGDPYFTHPIWVAYVLTELKLDTASIITALLHDTVEDTLTTLEEIQRQFGPEVARLVDGVTKLSRIELQNVQHQTDQTKQAENFRKLVLAMSEDIRVLLVKLADRMHNMQTLHFLKNPEKRKRIARETMEIYAPLAERIGMQRWQDELEELSFAELNADAYLSIRSRLEQLEKEGAGDINRIIAELKRQALEGGLGDISVTGRLKTPYSIWRKMQRKNVAFEQMSDVMAFRLVVGSLELCYQALGLIHARYRVVPGRFKDYISTPKPNGYRSIHTTVIGPEQHRIEIQIRTAEMQEVADVGVAAHWSYKQGKPVNGQTDGKQYRWLRELVEILDHVSRPEEFLEHTKLELFQDQVFCFTPKGDLIALPRGATPVDFAYAVHSRIGDTCVGAKINGRMQPLRSPLQNGDQVEVLVSKNSSPSPDWENFVVSGKARARIRRFIRTQQRDEHIKLGRGLLERVFKQEGYEYSDKALDGVLRNYQQPTADDLLAAIGGGQTGSRDVFNSIFPAHRNQQTVSSDEKVVATIKARPKRAGQTSMPIRGLIPGMAVHHARCCHPIPGDRIVGIITHGKGVTIHTIDCETLDSFNDSPERWIDVSWDPDAEGHEETVGRVTLVVMNEPGALGALSTVIGKNGGNITNLKVTNRNQDFFELLIDVDVEDVRHLTNIMAALRATPVVNSVERARGR